MLLNRRFAAVVVAAFVLVIGSGSAAAAAAAAPSAQDTTFVQQAHRANLAEIAAGRLAQEKGRSDEVKRLGARLIADHTRLDDALGQVAGTLAIELPEVNAEQRATARRLEAATGAQFDALFIATRLEAHLVMIRLGETELAEGSDAAVRKLASEAAPVLAAHHTAIQRAGRALGVPTSVNGGTGGTAVPRVDRTAAVLMIAGGALVALLGGGYLARTRARGAHAR